MAITLADAVERLETILDDINAQNFGQAHIRTANLITALRTNGIIIHAVAVVESKKVDGNDSQEN